MTRGTQRGFRAVKPLCVIAIAHMPSPACYTHRTDDMGTLGKLWTSVTTKVSILVHQF